MLLLAFLVVICPYLWIHGVVEVHCIGGAAIFKEDGREVFRTDALKGGCFAVSSSSVVPASVAADEDEISLAVSVFAPGTPLFAVAVVAVAAWVLAAFCTLGLLSEH